MMTSKISSHSSTSHSSRNGRHRHHGHAGRLLVVLYSLLLSFSLISSGLFAAIIPLWNANFFHSTGIVRGDWPDGLPLIPLFITAVVSAHYLINIVIARRKSSKPQDYLKSRQSSSQSIRLAKTKLYLTLTILILLLTFLILSTISGLFRFRQPAVITSSAHVSLGSSSNSNVLSTLSLRTIRRSISDSNPMESSFAPQTGNSPAQSADLSSHSCTLTTVFTRTCNPMLYLLGDLQIAAISTGSFVWLLTFIVLVLQARDYQHQRRKQQRSLRSKAKAKAKLNLIEDELSQAEKGDLVSRKKIHHDRKKNGGKSSPDMTQSTTEAAYLQLPPHAHVAMNTKDMPEQDFVRPKQHYYDPNITPSRARSIRQPAGVEAITEKSAQTVSTAAPQIRKISPSQCHKQTTYSRAVDEARRKVKPAETMRDWLATR